MRLLPRVAAKHCYKFLSSNILLNKFYNTCVQLVSPFSSFMIFKFWAGNCCESAASETDMNSTVQSLNVNLKSELIRYVDHLKCKFFTGGAKINGLINGF